MFGWISTGLILVLSWKLWTLYQRINSLQKQIVQSSQNLFFETTSPQSFSSKMFLKLEIKNALEIAERESVLAQYLSLLSPERVQKKVYEYVQQELQEKLAIQGVQTSIEFNF
ncbi:MAG: hypothetical protein AABZ60_14150 [Planctomycetota bacterium]